MTTINLYKSRDDGSHPSHGNLVLRPNGEAFFGGAVYRREGYPLPQAEPLPDPEPISRFKTGDRVIILGGRHAYEGRTGTVHEETFQPHNHDFDVRVGIDGDPIWFYDREVDFAPTPPPVTHMYPEGLYKGLPLGDACVYVQHENETDRYTITYLNGPRDEQGIPAVNKRMSASIVSWYTLVAAA